MNLTDLQTFLDAADAGSFSGAARTTGLPKSTISRRVARLEDQLGVSLFVRNHPNLHLTADGKMLHQAASAPLRDIMEAERQITEQALTPSGTLNLNAPYGFGATAWFVNLVGTYQEAFPEVRVVLHLSNSTPDFLREGIDLAVWPCPQTHGDGLIARKLCPHVGGLYASPGFVHTYGQPQTLAEVVNYKCITFIDPPFDRSWPMQHVDGSQESVEFDPVLVINEFNAIAQAVLNNMGIGLLPKSTGDPLVSSGQLIPVLSKWRVDNGDVWMLWPESRHMATRVRAFVDHAVNF